MNRLLSISAAFDKSELLKQLVEKLACRRYDIGYSKVIVPSDWKAVDTSSTETYANGIVAVYNDENNINLPFTTSFLFTCTKEKNSLYKLVWGISLS